MSGLQSPSVATRFHHLSSVSSAASLFSPSRALASQPSVSAAEIVRMESELKHRLDSATSKIEEAITKQEVSRIADRQALVERIDSHLVDVLKASTVSKAGGNADGAAVSVGGMDTARFEVSRRLCNFKNTNTIPREQTPPWDATHRVVRLTHRMPHAICFGAVDPVRAPAGPEQASR